jgi:pimeloyl-ACP methyl ester carboxylesterase
MTESNNPVSVVLVHGGFVDGSGWQSLHLLLRDDGYAVRVVQHPTLSLDGDVAAARLMIDAQNGPVVLVSHSYGGVVITPETIPMLLLWSTSRRLRPTESVNGLIANPTPGAPVPPILPPRDGFLFLDRDEFHASFAGDVPADVAECMADSQVPWGAALWAARSANPLGARNRAGTPNYGGPDDPTTGTADDGRAGQRDGG